MGSIIGSVSTSGGGLDSDIQLESGLDSDVQIDNNFSSDNSSGEDYSYSANDNTNEFHVEQAVDPVVTADSTNSGIEGFLANENNSSDLQSNVGVEITENHNPNEEGGENLYAISTSIDAPIELNENINAFVTATDDTGLPINVFVDPNEQSGGYTGEQEWERYARMSSAGSISGYNGAGLDYSSESIGSLDPYSGRTDNLENITSASQQESGASEVVEASQDSSTVAVSDPVGGDATGGTDSNSGTDNMSAYTEGQVVEVTAPRMPDALEQTLKDYTGTLEAAGIREPGSGYVNGIINNLSAGLSQITDGLLGQSNSTCIQQARDLQDSSFLDARRVDGWTFGVFDTTPIGDDGGVRHAFVLGTDPIGTKFEIDPWLNEVRPHNPENYPNAKGIDQISITIEERIQGDLDKGITPILDGDANIAGAGKP